MESPRAHGFDFSGIALDLIKHNALARTLSKVFGERSKDLLVNRRIFNGRVGENKGRRVLELRFIGGGIRHHVLIGITIKRVQIAAVGAGLRQAHAGHAHRQGSKAR